MSDLLAGNVVRLLTDDELLINIGAVQGVEIDQIYKILDPRTMDVWDPTTRKNLGSLERIKAQVAITTVAENLAVGRIFPGRGSGISNAARILSGEARPSKLTSSGWPEDVAAGDPAIYTNRVVKRNKDGKTSA